jgi:hypothetical protein
MGCSGLFVFVLFSDNVVAWTASLDPLADKSLRRAIGYRYLRVIFLVL